MLLNSLPWSWIINCAEAAKPNQIARASPAFQSIIELLPSSGWITENSEIFKHFQKYEAIDFIPNPMSINKV